MLTREQLQAVEIKRVYDVITLPNPDRSNPEPVEVRIQQLYSDEYIDLIDSLTDDEGNSIKWRSKNMGSLMCVRCWVDEDGNQVLIDEDVKADWWKKQSPAFVTEFITKVRAFNKVGVVGNGVGTAVKNSEETDSD